MINIVSTDDVLKLSTVKEYLRIEFDYDDTTLKRLINMSLSHVENYTGKNWARYEVEETFGTFENLRLDWLQHIPKAILEYTDTGFVIQQEIVFPTKDNFIINSEPVDWDGLSISVKYDTGEFVNQQEFPVAEQIRLMYITHFYENREAIKTGVSAVETPLGIVHLMDTIKRGRV